MFKNLRKGLAKSCRNVRWKASVISYEAHAIERTYELRQQLLAGTYKVSDYQVFHVHEPKERTIMATSIKDRQFQHSLCDNLVYDAMMRSAIVDSCACMKGRGVDYCLNRVTHHLVKYFRHHGREGWVLKCDVHHYFDSIDHDVAKAAVRKRVHDPDAVRYIDQVIDSFGEIGIGLGSQLSQLIANAILDDLDHFIKEQLHVRHYVRYIDDFVLIHHDKQFLQECLARIREWMTAHRLELNRKTCIYPLKQGAKMLHWRFCITPSGRILRRMEKKKLGKQRRKLKKLAAKEAAGLMPPGTVGASHRSWMSGIRRGDTWYEQRRMHEFYNNLRKEYAL